MQMFDAICYDSSTPRDLVRAEIRSRTESLHGDDAIQVSYLLLGQSTVYASHKVDVHFEL